ncbi:MAG: hypothetical protein ACXIUW_09915 [Roseinatronobacter sp.]
MSMTALTPSKLPDAKSRKDGLIGLWGRMFHRDPEDYEAWLEERDMTIITATLMRLSERQLNRLGMSHSTLVLDVEDLALRAERDAQIASDVLSLVEDEATPDQHAIAAE